MEKNPVITDMEYEQHEVVYTELGDITEGTIGATIETHARLGELTNRVGNGEFHVATNVTIPCRCIDGRCGCRQLGPNAAGGTLSLAVADDLLEQRLSGEGSTVDMARNVYQFLVERGITVGAHTADQIHVEDASGCGANDKLPDIYRIIHEKASVIRELSVAFGIGVTDDDHSQVVAGALRRTAFSSGREVLDLGIMPTAGVEAVDTLVGEHGEVVAVINRRSGTTLDRDALAREFGDKYEAFNIDAWAFEDGARELYPGADDATIARVVTAMVYYNLATSLALCGPTMRVVVLQ